jgi:hypothetical protein
VIFGKCFQGASEDISSFVARFEEAAEAFRCFEPLTPNEEFLTFKERLRIATRKQVKLFEGMGMVFDSIPVMMDTLELIEESQGIKPKKRVNVALHRMSRWMLMLIQLLLLLL